VTQVSTEGQFKRVLSQREVLALAFGVMVGWGWVALAGGWVLSAGAMGERELGFVPSQPLDFI